MRRRDALWLLAAVPLLGLGVRALAPRSKAVISGPVTVAEQALVFRVRAQGAVESANTIAVSPPTVPNVWNFTITYLAPEGKPIEAGRPLIGFDTKKLADTLDVQRSELESARKELEKVELEEKEALDGMRLQQADLEVRLGKARRKLGVPEDLVASNELRSARFEQQAAERELDLVTRMIAVQERKVEAATSRGRAKVDRLASYVAQSEASIRAMTVAAPRPGFVVYVPIGDQKKPQVGESAWFGQQLLEIADLARMRVAAVVPEPDADKVRPGQRVEVRLDANPDRLFHGRVASLGRAFRTKSSEKPSVVFDARIEVDDPDPALMRPGMTAAVTILAETERKVIAVPERAVAYDERGAAVQVRGARRAVTVGRRTEGLIEITSGLAPGDVVEIPREGAS